MLFHKPVTLGCINVVHLSSVIRIIYRIMVYFDYISSFIIIHIYTTCMIHGRHIRQTRTQFEQFNSVVNQKRFLSLSLVRLLSIYLSLSFSLSLSLSLSLSFSLSLLRARAYSLPSSKTKLNICVLKSIFRLVRQYRHIEFVRYANIDINVSFIYSLTNKYGDKFVPNDNDNVPYYTSI